MGEGDSDFGEGDASRDVSDGVEQRGSEESDDERLGDFRARVELEGPQDEHPDGAGEELEGSEEPGVREDVESLLVEDVEDDVLEVPETEHYP